MFFSVSVYVDGGIYGLSERVGVGNAFACNVVGRAMVGRGAHDGQSGGVVYAFLHGECFERGQALVVVHGHYAVKPAVGAAAEESVGGVRAEGLYSAFLKFLYCRYYCFLFLGANQSAVGVRAVDWLFLYLHSIILKYSGNTNLLRMQYELVGSEMYYGWTE